ncbi:MAG: DUF433 domain-containing protein [Verrucomicrobiota bacterium JB022]|nr:DUF433 domain-containing protein [Verrucomicrobiota bacterium JB022]
MHNYPHIVSVPGVMQGKPCIKGTRITVANIVRQIGDGRSVEAICADYPQLAPEAIREALLFSSELASFETYELVS